MKNFIITTVMALLISGFAFTANAQDRRDNPASKSRAKVEKQGKTANKKQDLKLNVSQNSKKVHVNTDQKAIQENNDLLNEFVKTVDKCEIEHNKKFNDNNQFSQYVEKALRLSTKINTKLLTDAQKATFEASKAKLNGFLKR